MGRWEVKTLQGSDAFTEITHSPAWEIFTVVFPSGENCGKNELKLQELKKRWKSEDPGGEQHNLGES